ncbi:hypothetical protein Pmar_PMAR020957 [Perkinsus marinus ATCC 50983]|uniref:Uncharacterized protein n=1 Tax=Perkinsus marinus (strain ATCC 50983 / TXsc) TaxID=423536 RepID=C5KKX9_PERM5|nr:hypothetical protein Pmar_PMAR020957 [Perkinsus marinus ATCC 50983]EER14862.1 hypothetical protein Pmar_PMAR020957 [Perkinsus marinus ATCC 50983]|eukprot:XP_002783066.1 hypothetical protein Pmar_PMAR020957 [Perkinsus marinus ATCC 50983]
MPDLSKFFHDERTDRVSVKVQGPGKHKGHGFDAYGHDSLSVAVDAPENICVNTCVAAMFAFCR